MAGPPSSRAMLVAVAAAALLTTGALPASGGVVRVSDVTIAVSASKIRYPGTVTISGQVTGIATGASVELQANAYPFAGFATVDQATASTDGSYTFTVGPTVNTRYRVVATGSPPQTSRSAAIVVEPGRTQQACNYCHPGSYPAGGFEIRQSGTWRYPDASVPRSSLKIYVYAGFNVPYAGAQPAHGTRLHLLGVRGSGVSSGGGKYKWHLSFRAPAGTRSFWFEDCWRDPPGFGPLNGKHNCGVTRTVRFPPPYLG
jgi:hypothetical protein